MRRGDGALPRGHGDAAAGADRGARRDRPARQQTLREAGLVARLHELGIPAGRLPQLAVEANQQWTKRFNPVEVGESELFSLYQEAF